MMGTSRPSPMTPFPWRQRVVRCPREQSNPMRNRTTQPSEKCGGGESGLEVRVVDSLGRECYDITPSRYEIAGRHFYLLAPDEPADTAKRWTAGETSSNANPSQTLPWTRWWLPAEQAHV